MPRIVEMSKNVTSSGKRMKNEVVRRRRMRLPVLIKMRT